MGKGRKVNIYTLNRRGSSIFQDMKQETTPYTPLTSETTKLTPTVWGETICPNNKINNNCIKNLKISVNNNEKISGCYSNPFNAPNTPEDCWRQPDPYARTLRVGETPLSRAFFSPQNVNYHCNLVTERIKEKYGIDIGVQPYRATENFMLKAFQDVNCDMCQDNGLEKGLAFLNKYTADGLLQRVARNVGQHIGYLRFMDEASWSIKIDNPKYTRDTYKDALSLSSYYNGCPYQK